MSRATEATSALERSVLALGRGLAILMGCAAVFVAAFFLIDEATLRMGAIAAGVLVVLLAEPLALRRAGAGPRLKVVLWLVDASVVAGFLFTVVWFFRIKDDLWDGLFWFETTDVVAATIGLVVVCEMCRRAYGAMLVIIAAAFFGFALLGPELPGVLRHVGVDYEEAIRTTWYSFDGVFGRATGIVANVVLVFIVLGAVLESTGAGAMLIRLSVSLTSRIRGGAAHAAIVASAFFGTFSGSVAANIVGTGVFTIPMIKRQGFRPAFAGAVEAAASSGGQLTPPIMAAAAFVMADLTGVPYLLVALAALVPAIFKYLSLFAQVYAEAIRLGIEPIPESERPRLTRDDWIQSLLIFLPVAALVVALAVGRSPAFSGVSALAVAIVSGLVLNPDFRRNPGRLLTALATGGRNAGMIMVAVGVIGIVLGVINETGLAIRFALLIGTLGEHNVALALLLAMCGALVLGMGLPTLPAYLIIVLIMGPPIVELGISVLAVHMFVLYFGVYSSIVPPVSYGAYVAAPIAGASPMATTMQALRITTVGFLIPYVFVFNPSILLIEEFSLWSFLWVVARMLVAIWLIATAFAGVETVGRIGPLERVLRFTAGIAAIVPVGALEISGAVAGIALIGLRQVRGSTRADRVRETSKPKYNSPTEESIHDIRP